MRISDWSSDVCSSDLLDLRNAEGRPLFALGAGEWDVPQLRSLLGATLSCHARIEAYEMDLKGAAAPRRLVLNAQKLDYGDMEQVRLLPTISDVTDARRSEKRKDDLTIGRAECRERGCKYVKFTVGAGELKK